MAKQRGCGVRAGYDALNGALKHSEVSSAPGFTQIPPKLFEWESYQNEAHKVEIHNNFSNSLGVLF